MKKIGVKEGNLIIADFMGYMPHPEFPTAFCSKDEDDSIIYPLNYLKSWDDLMPVVEKIAEMKYPINIYISHVQKTAYVYDMDENHYIIRENSTIQSPIETTFRAVVDFIKIYNKTNKNK